MKIPAHSFTRSQHGFTLVEFMVAMAMSLFCVLAMAGIYMGVRNGFFGQSSLSAIQENERLVVNSITNSIQPAGYFLAPQNGNTAESVFAQSTVTEGLPYFAAGQYITGSTSADGKSVNLSVRFQTAKDDGVLTCLGTTNTSAATRIYTNTFVYQKGSNGDGQLQCTVTDDAGSAAATATLATGLADFKVSYGVDADGDSSVDYFTSSIIGDDSLWTHVIAVKVAMTFKNTVEQTASKHDLPTIVQYISIMNNHVVRAS